MRINKEYKEKLKDKFHNIAGDLCIIGMAVMLGIAYYIKNYV